MSTGNKTVRSRQNARSRAAKKPERRGGARPGAGQPKKSPIAREALRKELIERFKTVTANKKEMGKHWLDRWIEVFEDNQFRCTNAGGKLISDMFHFIFNEPPSKKTPWIPAPPVPESDQEDTRKTGPPKLPPLKPDPANVASFNKGEQR